MASNALYLQSEKVSKMLPLWQDQPWQVAYDLIERKGDLDKIGERDYRVPVDLAIGGRVGTYNPDFGDMGRGSGPEGNFLISSYFPFRLNFELSHLAIKATADKSVAAANQFKVTVKKAVPEMMQYLDKYFHSDGTALIAQAVAHSSVSGTSVYTLDAARSSKLLRRGQYVTIYNNAFDTVISSAVYRVTGIDNVNRTVKLSGVVPGAGATDKITFEGVSGPTPAGFKGLYYWHSIATSGMTGGINRANEPEVIANGVDGSGGLTPLMPLLAYHRVVDRRGEMADQVVGLASLAQHAAAINNVVVIQTLDISKGVPSSIDRLPKSLRNRSFELGGIPIYLDRHQLNDRIDIFPPAVWGRTQLDPLHFYEAAVGQGGETQRFFELTGGSGAPAAGVWFGLTIDQDYYCANPGAAVVIYNLPSPVGY
jgi:hypothetical protein